MKKLLIILLIASGLYSCGFTPLDMRKPMIVDEIKQIDENFAYYYGTSTIGEGYYTPTATVFRITDSIGKYQLGDTIKIIRK